MLENLKPDLPFPSSSPQDDSREQIVFLFPQLDNERAPVGAPPPEPVSVSPPAPVPAELSRAAAATPPEAANADAFTATNALETPGEPDEVADWKAALRRDFEAWLATMDALPAAEEAVEADASETPDLYSFYTQLAAANTETRKAHRRTAEAFSQWSDTLARFESSLAPLRDLAATLAPTAEGDRLARHHCLVLIEWLDRMHRLAQAFETSPPRKRWWTGDRAWRKAWETQRQGLQILLSHLEELLQKEGLRRLPVVGEPFDPTTMVAVAVDATTTQPVQAVVEELAAGYLRDDELLRPAQVKVTRKA